VSRRPKNSLRPRGLAQHDAVALSRQIQLLERILDVTLERTSRTVSLTPAGRVFLIEARRIVRLAERAHRRGAAKGDAGKVAIGFTAVSGYTLVPQIVAQARASLPNIELELREMVSTDQTDALLTGLIDIGFVRPRWCGRNLNASDPA
jgi:DNA-binding transcriptional LysR family regulator